MTTAALRDTTTLGSLELRRAVVDHLPAIVQRVRLRQDPLEAQCRAFLADLRWPAGVVCPRCDESMRLHRLEARDKWHCYACRYQFSVTAGTLFHRSHLPLWKWFAAIHLMTASNGTVTTVELAERLGGSYKSYWFTAHRIRVAMRTRVASGPGPLAAGERRVRRGTSKYRAAYDGERRWLDENRASRSAFTDVVEALLAADPVSYDELTRAASGWPRKRTEDVVRWAVCRVIPLSEA